MDHLDQRVGEVGAEVAQRHDRGPSNVLQHLPHGLAGEEPPPGEALPEDRAERELVAAAVDGERARLLGGHVRRAPQERPAAGEPDVPDARRHLNHAEVEEHRRLDVPAAREEDVAGLEVAVHVAAGVDERERRREGDEPVDQRRRRDRPLRGEAGRERVAVQALQREVAAAVHVADREHADDVGVGEHRVRLRLAVEAGERLGVVSVARVEDLERHASLEGNVRRLVHRAERARAEEAADEEIAEAGPGLQGGAVSGFAHGVGGSHRCVSRVNALHVRADKRCRRAAPRTR